MPKLTSPLGLFRGAATRSFERAFDHNIEQIANGVLSATGRVTDRTPRILDLGCWDGVNTLRMAPVEADFSGVELSAEAGARAKERGIEVTQADLNESLPFSDASFDVVMSNQVIEHLKDTDMFVQEAFRVLSPGGTVVISTENMSSWHNIGALVLGWQAFSLTNISDRSAGIGNPLALTREWDSYEAGWQHIRIFSFRGLKELFEAHGFVDVTVRGAGYYPLPSRMADVDPRHAAFITVAGTKPTN